ncbi:MAG: hypothetical protein AAB320_01075 [Elusimicrobiota bacterium]
MRQARKPKRKSKEAFDPILHEFETKDLAEDIIRSGVAVVIRPKQMATSILLPPAIIEKLKVKAAKRGIGYQTMLKIIVHEHVDDY